jgi:hypothetical protein
MKLVDAQREGFEMPGLRKGSLYLPGETKRNFPKFVRPQEAGISLIY